MDYRLPKNIEYAMRISGTEIVNSLSGIFSKILNETKIAQRRRKRVCSSFEELVRVSETCFNI